jgi:hypothetical protein
MRHAPLLLILSACGSSFPAQTCNYFNMSIQTAAGVNDSCLDYGQQILSYRTLFLSRFGGMSMDGWSFFISPLGNPKKDGSGPHAGYTEWNGLRGTITLSQHALDETPHELFHVKLGPDSRNHGELGWCSDLSPWEISQGLPDERAYLGCR